MWEREADRLARDLGDVPNLARRIHHLYLPVLFFCAAQARASSKSPLLIGIQAPQGAGKTTLVRYLVTMLEDFDLRAVAVSIDDFYLTRDAQLRLAARHPGNPYLEHRGYPGTHDIELGVETLNGLQRLGRADQSTNRSIEQSSNRAIIRVPVYDKSAHAGRGDRAPESEWREVTAPIDLVFVEGWMLGFTPAAENQLDDPFLVEPNRALAEYDRWHRLLDAFVTLRMADPQFVIHWRVEAEEAMRASGRGGLDRAAIEDYVRRFLPAYALYGGAPPSIARNRQLEILLDEERCPIVNE